MINRTAEYALRAVVFLASKHGTPSRSKEIAEQTKVPNDYLAKVLRQLDQAGVVSARRGPGGGYELVAVPEKTNAYDIISAVTTASSISPICLQEHSELLSLYSFLDEASALVASVYKGTTIAQMISSRTSK